METQELYLTLNQADDIRSKLQKHIDDLLLDIKNQVVSHLEDIIISYLPDEQPVKRKKSTSTKKRVKK